MPNVGAALNASTSSDSIRQRPVALNTYLIVMRYRDNRARESTCNCSITLATCCYWRRWCSQTLVDWQATPAERTADATRPSLDSIAGQPDSTDRRGLPAAARLSLVTRFSNSTSVSCLEQYWILCVLKKKQQQAVMSEWLWLYGCKETYKQNRLPVGVWQCVVNAAIVIGQLLPLRHHSYHTSYNYIADVDLLIAGRRWRHEGVQQHPVFRGRQTAA